MSDITYYVEEVYWKKGTIIPITKAAIAMLLVDMVEKKEKTRVCNQKIWVF